MAGARPDAHARANASVDESALRLHNAASTLTVLNKIDYAARHGYDFVLDDAHCAVGRSHAAFGKNRLLTALLPHYDWVLVIDNDALFANMSVRLDDVLRDAASTGASTTGAAPKDVVVSRDWNGINTGVMAVRRSEWSMQFFARVLSPPRQCAHAGPWWEQSVIACLLDERKSGMGARVDGWRVAFVPQRELNAYPEPFDLGQEQSRFRAGDFIAHFAGASAFVAYRFSVDDLVRNMTHLCAEASGAAAWRTLWARRSELLRPRGRWHANGSFDSRGASLC
jgi:hypothetical protein